MVVSLEEDLGDKRGDGDPFRGVGRPDRVRSGGIDTRL